jgi:hypothetical protein
MICIIGLLVHTTGQLRFRTVTIALALLLAIGYLDYITGPEISFRIFYVAPIALVAWRTRQLPSALVALAATIVWFVADVASGAQYSHGFNRYWNAAALFAFYLIVAFLLCRLRDALQQGTRAFTY